MNNRASLALVLIFSLFISITAQQKNPNPKPNQQTTPQQTTQQQDQVEKEDVVRITTNLVQVDAIITDKSGKQVTDLKPEEVEIYEDGREQKITNFSYISTESGTAQPVEVKKPAVSVDKYAPPIPPVHLKPEQVRRTIALVVDDLGLSFESLHFVQQALKKFVDKQVQPGDLVAILRTRSGMGALQQFTTDKRQLYAAIDRVHWFPGGRSGVMAVAPIDGGFNGQVMASPEMAREALENGANGSVFEGVDEFRNEQLMVGTLGALNYIVRGMRELPGRKSILLVSDGLPIKGQNKTPAFVMEELRHLVDQANRAAVNIYTMDARGLQTLGLTAADSTSRLSAQQLGRQLQSRRDDFYDSQAGLSYLAELTGGISIQNNNDLSAGMRRILDDQKGYYLIGYRPDQSTFDPKTGRRTFHKLSIKVKRPGVKVRSRSGFYGVTDEESAPRPSTYAQQMVHALISPFAESGIHLRLTSLFANDPQSGSFMRSMLHIDAKDLTFTDEPDGWHKTIFNLLAITFGVNGSVVDQVAYTHTVRVRGETYKRILESGFVYYVTVPVKKPGAYQLRTALRDSASEHVGSASQFIEVPDINENRLTISGIVTAGMNPVAIKANDKGAAGTEGGQQLTAEDAAAKDESEELTDPQSTPAVRKFHQGMLMQFNYIIYNAQLDKATQTPQLQTQIHLFRDGKQVFAGKQQPFNPADQPDLKRLAAGGVLQLGTELPPGEYILQVVVTDPLAKEKYRVATQWIDFEIVK